MTNKVTKREMFNAVKGFVQGGDLKFSVDEVVAFIDHEIDLLDKKSANKKPTKTQTENEGVKAIILEVLADSEPKTVTEILATGKFAPLTSPQKISALLKQMVENDGTVSKSVEKKVSRFSVA